MLLREGGTSETQTLPSVLSDETLTCLESGNTGSHSDLFAVQPRAIGGEVQKVPKNLVPSRSKGPLHWLSGGDKREVPTTKHESPTPAHRRWTLKLRYGNG